MDSVHVSSQGLLIFALACVVGAAIVAFARKKNQSVVELKKEALDAGGFMQAIGLPHSATFWNAIALEDVPTAIKELHVILAIFRSPEQRAACMAKVVDTYITDMLKDGDDDEVARLQKLLSGTWAQAAQAPTPTGQQLAQLSGILNPYHYAAQLQSAPMQAQGGTFFHLPPAVQVQPPATTTTVAHGIASAEQTAAAIAAKVAAAVPAV